MRRTWLNHERRALPSRARLPPEAQRARCEQRDANDLVELRFVPMPADSCAGPIFVDENLAEGILRTVKNRSDLAPQRLKKVRKRRRVNHGATVIS